MAGHGLSLVEKLAVGGRMDRLIEGNKCSQNFDEKSNRRGGFFTGKI